MVAVAGNKSPGFLTQSLQGASTNHASTSAERFTESHRLIPQIARFFILKSFFKEKRSARFQKPDGSYFKGKDLYASAVWASTEPTVASNCTIMASSSGCRGILFSSSLLVDQKAKR
jgi:hypothetical protein